VVLVVVVEVVHLVVDLLPMVVQEPLDKVITVTVIILLQVMEVEEEVVLEKHQLTLDKVVMMDYHLVLVERPFIIQVVVDLTSGVVVSEEVVMVE
jgi:hypothetical protein